MMNVMLQNVKYEHDDNAANDENDNTDDNVENE